MYFALLNARLIAHLRGRVRGGESTERGLARAVGMSQPHLHNVLKGVKELSPGMADRILKSLGLTVLDLLEQPAKNAEGPRFRRIPLFTGRLGPGHPFPVEESPDEAAQVPFSAAALLEDPAIAILAEDTAMTGLFREGDLALLDRAEGKRRRLQPDGLYALQVRGEGRIRRVRLSRDRLYFGVTGPPRYISVAERNILETVQARVIWIGRNVE